MTDWGEGYVTDVPYMPGFYRLQSPSILVAACLLKGVPTIDLRADPPLSYLELGCGTGLTAMVLAACNPQWRVTAVDFNPGHIAAAQQLAAEARLPNIRFLEADLATLAEDPGARDIPECDVVSFHGLWSWISSNVKSGILRLLRAKVRPGGIVHASYNVLPAWQAAIGLQKVVREAGRRSGGRSDSRAQAGMEFAKALLAAGAAHVKQQPFVVSLLESVEDTSAAYLAHEFMNDHWRPCFHADVVADFAEAKLDWVASASLPENFRQLSVTEPLLELADRFHDPLMTELVKDMGLTRGLRQDVFVRGARHLSIAERNAGMGEVVLALTRMPEQFEYEVGLQVGKATLEPGFYRPIVEALHERPRRVRELLALPDVVGKRDNPAELIAMLVGTDQAVPVVVREPLRDDPAARLNRAAVRALLRPETLTARFGLASSHFGAAINATGLEMLVWGKLDADPEALDVAGWATEAALGREGTDIEKLRNTLGTILEHRAPVWRRLGILP